MSPLSIPMSANGTMSGTNRNNLNQDIPKNAFAKTQNFIELNKQNIKKYEQKSSNKKKSLSSINKINISNQDKQSFSQVERNGQFTQVKRSNVLNSSFNDGSQFTL